ncbi:coiled-coil domain-containing protein 181 [Salmo trutta]|uniref:Coiled-coil domain-containing protein 181 n=1 Tax=Salmo trutta TaxID=8032 RepID=A0A673WQL7_SALTR|nr:coiled-coil domain-containing protein 181 [Salmo trutta]XP_029562269.1 coiled-coil domain-containing protein 181 [Salmo trutta]
MSLVPTSTRTQEEYEDDFEKDLDWLISEEGTNDGQEPDYEDIEAEIDKELKEEGKEEEKKRGRKEDKKSPKEEKWASESEKAEEEERWPSPMEPLEFDSDRDSPYKGGSPAAPPPPVLEDQPEEEKKYILEKIQLANRQLQDQEAPDMTRRRRLHFKETLVDLVVAPLEYEKDSSTPQKTGVVEQVSSTARGKEMEVESEVSGKLSELKITPREGEGGGQGIKDGGGGGGGEAGQSGPGKEGKVLVEKDGKFDLVSLKEVESRGLMLPPLASFPSDNSRSSSRPSDLSPNKTPTSSPLRPISSTMSIGIEHHRAPRPPAQPRNRPNSASHSQRGSGGRGTKRRVQSANSTPSQQATFTLSPQQKELLNKIQERRERLAREEEQRKREEDEQKRQENELAFRAWLVRKKEQLQEEKRIYRAQEMERSNGRREHSDPDEAFKSWLQRKHEQQQRDRQLEEMKRLEEESGFYLHNREECERAFKLWLKKKRAEKRAEQQAARERSRRLVFEERRARRMQDLLCTVNETKPFRFTEHLAYRF